ncbi:bifunctional proline dehydrogenase/L-glutamate gamma-semialdehyde dehydrogenase [Veronia nyctiphanis]|uniref:Bifunctional protein PutA n=1 Tax=Veronia nyctiphanis TaxID=1278244 RepID=A0A4Q0YSF8_9GAMM|nr:bifunctional proline dehydrogenase/L-glutamate gamma-semialdehyde dehydrogenase PutA [Veronia nyctiphanis]RXJ71891.1 bifunctional proline dehydrogenase/L-glutamate gamma-semialdehyde dehydrogenase [Veronia nyctiphanis]
MFKAIDVLAPAFIEQPLETLWQNISPLYCVDESQWLKELLPLATPSDAERKLTDEQSTRLIESVRADNKAVQMIDALLLEYSLDTREGILLMCLAEALMRVPDSKTADALIRDKLGVADWKSHLKSSESVFVNASTWGLMLTGKVVNLDEQKSSPVSTLNRLVNKFSEPVIRQAMHQAMKIMGHQFVLGRNINEALKNGEKPRDKGFTYSFDMLGEAALTRQDAQKYFNDYMEAIEAVGRNLRRGDAPEPSVSIKLSALHPRYEVANTERVMTEMYDTVLALLDRAIELGVAITVDAEEADRLELSLKLFEKLYTHPTVAGWGKFGLVVQAYSKRALPVITWLAGLARAHGTVIPMRLVKGAYWDTEIKLAQQHGHHGYPVYTRKEATDVAYLACARFLLSDQVRGLIYPQFASHNAHTVAAISAMAPHGDFEFQRLHGMGEALYNHAMSQFGNGVRIYAPVGSHKDLLPYLVRRLLENGANSSFVHRLVDARCPISDLIQHPVDALLSRETLHNNRIPMPVEVFGENRKNSMGVATDIESEWTPFADKVAQYMTDSQWHAAPLVNGETLNGDAQPVLSPYNRSLQVGTLAFASEQHASQALDIAAESFASWAALKAEARGEYLLKLADKLEENLPELVALCHREAGKTIHDSIDEVREAVDFLRYYPVEATTMMDSPESFTHFTGESRTAVYSGRGVFTCISPWNFPLAIFIGQVAAALVAGNTVVAKPAEQTSLIAYRAIQLLLETGIPAGVVHLLPGKGAVVGNALTRDERIAGVAFTGSTPTAQRINQSLAQRDAEPVPLIAETGGQNAMIVDSTALPEQVVRDVLRSAFASAGQRCSALRVLYVQEDIAERVITLIRGAMSELSVGEPSLLSTDVGPVIDEMAQRKLKAHIAEMDRHAEKVASVKLDASCDNGTFVAPTAFEIDSISRLDQEHFGPILHILRYKADELDQIIDQINQTGFGLTLGVHSRNEGTYRHIDKRARVGNCYINRDQVGAMVGVQPFGGQGLSGTGPKAGGPHYLHRFAKVEVQA